MKPVHNCHKKKKKGNEMYYMHYQSMISRISTAVKRVSLCVKLIEQL